MTSLLENMKRTAHEQLNGFKQWDLDAMLAPRADNCVYTYLPHSMGRPPMNNDAYRQYFSSILPLLQGFDFTLASEVYDERARMSVIHGISTATSAIGPYKMEAIILMTFNESGEKIVKIDEMMDSAYMADCLQKLTEHMESQATVA